MKKMLFAASAIAAVLTMAASARAADLPAKAAPYARPACAQFGGLYVGGQVGWGYYDHIWKDHDAWSSEEEDQFSMQRSTLNITKNGFVGGVQGGYNWQSGCTVFGIEADYNWAKITASTIETDGELGDDRDTLSVSSRLKGIGTLRTRGGVVVDNLLIYLTGGLAVARFDRSYTLASIDPAAVETFAYNVNRWGWTAGVGTEWAINNNWSIKSEVLYARFSDDKTFACSNPEFCTDGPESKRFGHQDAVWISRIGVNYRFGSGTWGR